MTLDEYLQDVSFADLVDVATKEMGMRDTPAHVNAPRWEREEALQELERRGYAPFWHFIAIWKDDALESLEPTENGLRKATMTDGQTRVLPQHPKIFPTREYVLSYIDAYDLAPCVDIATVFFRVHGRLSVESVQEAVRRERDQENP